ncbi:aminoacyl-tRNA hydrolase [Romboutsia sedimentorum]|jgi:PTH1 family peptidyl-tRNA hydrolase|uniref:Peptidyl-tRNA hydrolase n=1 Tax=Romboutsia sedimentorum TaxID=1368474 RepID=A0ABT7ECV9_9FIRM|nr:aminoacyl-tRNA hydrolase [Romboutsia sedimentorum]MDK2564769.1 aminoacyl-tRNA hydrolase [Romboutsia sedimentorum]MDK2586932.1 aminoacyl-tRNA hydrolase [Romboutsia sedimentorum]
MYIVVGLGNPGKQYDKTRHNVGFNVIDILAKEYDISVTKIKHKALIGEGRIGSEKVLLVKPQTYMNLSGETLIDIYQYYKVDLSNIIVVYDDIDLDVGKLRIRTKGSGGTHNGMRSITKCLGSTDFPRVRVGVSKPRPGQDLADFVLSKFRKEEAIDLENGLEKAYRAVDTIIRENIEISMNKYNG